MYCYISAVLNALALAFVFLSCSINDDFLFWQLWKILKVLLSKWHLQPFIFKLCLSKPSATSLWEASLHSHLRRDLRETHMKAVCTRWGSWWFSSMYRFFYPMGNILSVWWVWNAQNKCLLPLSALFNLFIFYCGFPTTLKKKNRFCCDKKRSRRIA